MKTKLYTFCSKVLIILLSSYSFAQAESWTKVNSGTSKKLNTIYFSSPTIGYIGGNDSLLLKTMDGGLTWNKVNFSGVTFYPTAEHILNLQFLNDSIGFMTIGPYIGSYKTTDGGLTWTLLPTAGNQCYNQGLYFFDENNGFIGGSGCFQGEIISQLSAGTWNTNVLNSIAFNPANIITAITFLNSNFGLASSRSGYIYRTTDGGSNWDSVRASVDLNPITSIAIINDTLAYAGYEAINIGFGLYVSTDGGLSWNQDLNSATFYYPDFLTLHQSGEGKLYTGGVSQNAEGLIFSASDPFINWSFNVVDEKINDISSYQDSIVFAVGDSGYIAVNKALNGLGVGALQNQSPIWHIYPNPAKNMLHINVSEEIDFQKASLKIYSTPGALIYQSDFTPQLSISNWSKGIYVVEISTETASYRKKLVIE